MMKEKLNSKKGFTLAELLIVVAIIAVLVAIAIPVFTARLEQSRETTDIANLRSAYAAGQVAALSGIDTTAPSALSGTPYYYDAGNDYGLSTGSATAVKGQGTAKDGKANSETLPSGVEYDTGKDVRGKPIVVEFTGSGLASVHFAD